MCRRPTAAESATYVRKAVLRFKCKKGTKSQKTAVDHRGTDHSRRPQNDPGVYEAREMISVPLITVSDLGTRDSHAADSLKM